MFQALPIGQQVSLQVCRGYPLPFDPNDPNTEIITTVAVNLPDPNNRPPAAPAYTKPSVPPPPPPDYTANNKRTNHWGDNNGGGNGDDTNDTDSAADAPVGVLTSPPQLLSIGITKGALGFGFTIADSAYGQRVKQILDRPRCKTLQEGDILVEINGKKVKDLAHAGVVQVLKDCSKDQEAAVLVQRGGVLNKKRTKTPTVSIQHHILLYQAFKITEAFSFN